MGAHLQTLFRCTNHYIRGNNERHSTTRRLDTSAKLEKLGISSKARLRPRQDSRGIPRLLDIEDRTERNKTQLGGNLEKLGPQAKTTPRACFKTTEPRYTPTAESEQAAVAGYKTDSTATSRKP